MDKMKIDLNQDELSMLTIALEVFCTELSKDIEGPNVDVGKKVGAVSIKKDAEILKQKIWANVSKTGR